TVVGRGSRRHGHPSEKGWRLLARRGAQGHLETGATAVAWHTAHITAMVSSNLAHQGETQANTAIAALRHAAGTVEGSEDAFALLGWHTRTTIGNAQVGPGRAEWYHRGLDRRAVGIAPGVLEEVAHEPT